MAGRKKSVASTTPTREGHHDDTEASKATKRRTSVREDDIPIPPAKRLKKGPVKNVHKSKPEDEFGEEDVRVHDGEEDERVEKGEEAVRVPVESSRAPVKSTRAPVESKRVTRAASKRPDKEPVDKGAGGAKKSAGGSKSIVKPTGKSSAKSTSSKPKKTISKAPDKGKGKKGDEPREERNNTVLKKPKILKQFDIRRILAERDVGKERFYNVDWYPSWVKAKTVRKPNIDDWETTRERYTLQWDHDTVYRIANPSGDTSDEMIRQLLESVLQMYQTYMNKPPNEIAGELFQHDDWEFYSPKDRKAAIQAAADADDDHPTITAAEVMQHTYIEAWNNTTDKPGSSHARRYGNIRVQFAGEIDEEATSHRIQPEKGMRTVEFIDPIFADGLWDPEYMDVANWNVNGTDKSQAGMHLDVLQPLIANLVTQCPYLLKKPWPLIFISLFYWDSEIKDLLDDSDFEFELVGATEDPNRWALRIRDTMIYTFMRDCEWEMRCMDEVNETFVQAQDFIEGALASTRSAPDSDGGDNGEGPSAAHARKGSGGGGSGASSSRKGPSGSGDGPSGPGEDKGKGTAKAENSDKGEISSGSSRKKGFSTKAVEAYEKDEAQDDWETSTEEEETL
ncbi:hypothetical protein N0V95_008882 [Ascochyta clinopodiicola]|nr:hypothetical protein N0V95_008882 [Ascochyta clinopodiicola]